MPIVRGRTTRRARSRRRGFTARRREVRVGAPRRPFGGADVGQRRCRPSRRSRARSAGRRPRPRDRARAAIALAVVARARRNGLLTTRAIGSVAKSAPQLAGLHQAEVAQRRVDAPLQPPVAVQLRSGRAARTRSRGSPRRSRGGPYARTCGAVRDRASPNRVHAHHAAARPSSSSIDEHGPGREQRRFRPGGAERGPPEQLPCAPTTPLSTSAAEPADREAQRAPAPEPAAAPGRGEHRDHQHDDRGEQRVRVRLRAERQRRSRAAASAPSAISRKSSPELWNTFHTPKIDPNVNQKNMSDAASSAAFDERVGVGVLSRAARARGRTRRSRRATGVLRPRSGRRFACLIFHAPRNCSITSSESARTWTRARAELGRGFQSPRSTPCTRRRCSSSRRCTR